MVTRILLLLGLFAALFTAACGGDDNVAATATRPAAIAPTATAAAGPQAIVEPKAGPPGTEVTVTGSGWAPGVLIDLTGELAPGATADPYETVVSNQDGTFSVHFRLEAMPDGADLSTGRYNLIARSSTNQVTIPFLVETKRPVGSSGPTG